MGDKIEKIKAHSVSIEDYEESISLAKGKNSAGDVLAYLFMKKYEIKNIFL